MHISEFETI